jgi:hypothetical protein
MTKQQHLTTWIAAALLLTATLALAEAPAPAARLWAAPGDLIDGGNHWTIGLDVLDDYGYAGKAAEDWGLTDQYRFSGLFGWRQLWDDGRWLSVQGIGDNGGEPGGAGFVGLQGGDPGKWRYAANYRSTHLWYDGTNELKHSATFAAGPPPAALDPVPVLNWNRGVVTAGYHAWDGFDLRFGARQTRRSGSKSSLAVSGLASGTPGVRTFETETRRFWVGGDLAVGKLSTDWEAAYQHFDGDRGGVREDQDLWTARLSADYAATDAVRLFGHAGTAYLDAQPRIGTQSVTADAVSGIGQVGAIARLGRHASLKLSARMDERNTDGQTDEGDNVLQAVDRDRKRQEYRAVLTHTGFSRTRLQFGYQAGTSEQDETVALDGVPGSGLEGFAQTTDQKTTHQEYTFRGRRTFSGRLALTASADWQSKEVEQTDVFTDEALSYWMGDRKTERLRWKVQLRTRPLDDLRVDLGHQTIERTFERQDIDGAKTEWTAQRGFVNAFWTATDRLTLLAAFSMGQEEYVITDGPTVDADWSPVGYDATTIRYTPGVVLDLGAGVTAESHYEAVRNTDSVENDLDRWYANLGWRFKPELTLTASYRRYEFDENLWDDYILDLYSLSMSGRF